LFPVDVLMSAKPRDSDFRGEEANRDQGHVRPEVQKPLKSSLFGWYHQIVVLQRYSNTEINMISISIKGHFDMQEFHTNCIEIS